MLIVVNIHFIMVAYCLSVSEDNLSSRLELHCTIVVKRGYADLNSKLLVYVHVSYTIGHH